MSIDKNLYPLAGVYRQELTKLRNQRDELLQLVRDYSSACNCWTCELCRRAEAAIAAYDEEDK